MTQKLLIACKFGGMAIGQTPAFKDPVVKDNGPGIDKKYHEKIFEIFQSLQSNESKEITGMGLTLVKKILETYGSKIWLESELKTGTIFYFNLPKNNK